MSYIGQQLPADVFSGYVTDTFTGDGSATTFTLSKAPFSADSLIVVVDNVIQQPTVNFTVSGTTLTIVGTAILSGIKGYAIHTGGPVANTLASKVDVNGLSDGVILDADGDTTISADTDDQIDIKIGGADDFAFKANNFEVQSGSTIDMNGQELILDADADTSITADTDDQIDFKCAGKDTININQYGQIKFTRDSATTFGGSASFIHQRGTIASPSIVNSGDTIGLLQSAAYDGTAYLDGPRILFQVDGTPGDDDMPTRIVFQTTADGTAGTLAEVMRLGNDKNVTMASGVLENSTADIKIYSTDTGHCGIRFANAAAVPVTNSGGTSDGAMSFGSGSYRWATFYATSGSINTSDRNEKQDIEELTDAEKRVAVAAKGLLRKYKFKDAVEKKGDDARTHFGIIAQDLEDAFTAEGLDASKYGMFCSNTWWETEDDSFETEEEAPEGATKRTRLGVRYSELLAFIIGGI
jgi:hypothetical protein